ncbi:MAG: 8-amino-7-oxononanoate synthase [Pseudomonadota bacterium]
MDLTRGAPDRPEPSAETQDKTPKQSSTPGMPPGATPGTVNRGPTDHSRTTRAPAPGATDTDASAQVDPAHFAALARALKALDRRGRLRSLAPRTGLDFASNDYLGLASSPAMREAITHAILQDGVDIGSGGSRLLRGNHPQHEALEAEAAAFFGADSALYFSGGFNANAALIATLPQRGDLVVYDERVHASAHDGMMRTKADTAKATHNAPDHVAEIINAWRKSGGKGTPWIAVESLYSMDGDTAPLDALATCADETGAVMMIDEAHATGIFGPDGRGLAAHLEGRDNIITLHTCGKALGVMGGIICGPRIVKDFLINRAAGFIYATAPPPIVCAAVCKAFDLCKSEPQRRERLQARIAAARLQFEKHLGFAPSATQIQPVILGRETDAVTIASDLQEHGFDVRAIRPPTVAEGTARLRIAITNNVTIDDIEALATTLKSTLAKHRIEPQPEHAA